MKTLRAIWHWWRGSAVHTIATATFQAILGCTQSGRNDCLTGKPPKND